MELLAQNSEFYGNLSKIQSKIIGTFSELEQFKNMYNNKNGVKVDMSYLLTATIVRVFMNANGDWVAGYVINANKPMRYFAEFEPNIKKTILLDCNLKEDDMVEISCINIDRSLVKQNPEWRLEVYYQSIYDAVACKKPYLIGGSKVFTTWKTFEIILSKCIYFGFVPLDGGLELAKIVYNSAEDALVKLNEFKIKNI